MHAAVAAFFISFAPEAKVVPRLKRQYSALQWIVSQVQTGLVTSE